MCAQLPWGGYANVAEGSPTADAAGESGFTTAFCEVCDNGLTGLDHGIELKYSNIPFLAASPVQLMSLGPKHRRQWHIKEVEERPQEDVFFFYRRGCEKEALRQQKSEHRNTFSHLCAWGIFFYRCSNLKDNARTVVLRLIWLSFKVLHFLSPTSLFFFSCTFSICSKSLGNNSWIEIKKTTLFDVTSVKEEVTESLTKEQ